MNILAKFVEVGGALLGEQLLSTALGAQVIYLRRLQFRKI